MSDAMQGPQQPEYQMPQDQLMAEFNLTENYRTTTFMSDVLGYDLDVFKRFAGISIPKFKDPSPLSEGTELEDAPDDIRENIGGGFVALGSVNDSHSSETLMLQPQPKRLSQEEFDTLSQRDQGIYTTCMYGEHTEGEAYPLHTIKLLKDIYSLIGAKQVRDDTNTEPDGQLRGIKVYQGTYMDTEVYVEEAWQTFSLYDGSETPSSSYKIRTVTVRGADAGLAAVNELSRTEVNQLAQFGYNMRDIIHDGIDRTNFASYIQNIKEIDAIMPEGDTAIDQAYELREKIVSSLSDAELSVMTEDGMNRVQEIAGNAADVYLGAIQKANKRRSSGMLKRAIHRKKR